MPVPHFNIKITQRSKGNSAVAGAAYQAGEKLFSEYDQKTKNYTCKKEVVYTEIMLPPNAPPEYADRATLWNSVEEIEKQWNSQLARRFVAALPREVPMELLPQMVKEYCEEQFVSKGMEGKGPYQIANILSNEHIEIPAYYHQKLGIGLWKTREIKSPYRWGSSTIVHILTNPSYLGHTCNFKTRKHFKDKKSHYVDQDQWNIIKDTHEPIIDQETYDTVQRMRAGIRRYPDGWGEVHPLAGLLYCADCGSPMYIHRTGNGNRTANFSCSGYGKIPVGSKCASGHWVNADSVMKLIQETLREIVRFSKEDEEEFACIVRSEIENRQSSEMKGQKTRLTACQKRLDELETLLCKIYEDNILGKLPDKRYQILEAQYTKEQEALEAEIDSLQKKVDEYEQEQKSADKFIALVKKYQNFEELDAVMLNQFIYKIFVHERDYKGVANSPQTIEIYFNFVGKFGMQEINSPSEEERAALEEKERLRQKRHEAYLRRKASGWQDAYYQKTKAAKKAGIDAKKEAIRSEDRAKGVYYLPNQKYLETEPKGESA